MTVISPAENSGRCVQDAVLTPFTKENNNLQSSRDSKKRYYFSVLLVVIHDIRI